jgi:hypothetical protein
MQSTTKTSTSSSLRTTPTTTTTTTTSLSSTKTTITTTLPPTVRTFLFINYVICNITCIASKAVVSEDQPIWIFIVVAMVGACLLLIVIIGIIVLYLRRNNTIDNEHDKNGKIEFFLSLYVHFSDLKFVFRFTCSTNNCKQR